MLNQTSTKFRELILLEFTRQLIKNSGGELLELENALNKEERLKKEKEEKTEKSNEEKIAIEIQTPIKEIKPPIKDVQILAKPSNKPVIMTPLPVLRIPEPRFPTRLQYLRPIPNKREIDLSKLNPLIKDPMVNVIECHGPEEYIVVRGNMGIKKTEIVLDGSEIKDTIDRFSKASKIPLQKGVLRIVFGRLILLAIISDIVSQKFIIKKMAFVTNLDRPY